MMIADSHLHLFRHGYGQFEGPSPLLPASDVDAYERLMARHDISAGLVVCYEDEGIDPENNAYVRELAAGRKWIHSVAFVRADAIPRPEHIGCLLAAGHVGIAVYLPDEVAATSLLGWPEPTWELLCDARAIISLNARPEATRRLEPLIERAAGCTFLFSHMGLPGRHESIPGAPQAQERLEPLLRLAGHRNVGVKISGLYAVDPHPPHRTARPFVELLLERFPASRLHWGSDFSPALGFVRFEETVALAILDQLHAEERRLVMGRGLMARLARPDGLPDGSPGRVA